MNCNSLLGFAVIIVSLKTFLSAKERCPASPSGNRLTTLFGKNPAVCYVHVGDNIKDQVDANTWCRSTYRGYLARISEPTELTSVVAQIQNVNTDNIWVDLRCQVSKQNCTWQNRQFIGAAMLQKGEFPLTSSCGALKSGTGIKFTTWNTISCVTYHQYICQAPKILIDENKCGNDSFLFDGKCYKLIRTSKSRADATIACKDNRGQLAILSSQDVIIAATNYLSLEAGIPLGVDVWVGSVLEVTAAEEIALLTQQSINGFQVLDRHTKWSGHRTISGSSHGYPLCEEVEQLETTTIDETTFPVTSPVTTSITTTTTTERDAGTPDGTIIVIAVLGGGVGAIMVAITFLVCCRKTRVKRFLETRLCKEIRAKLLCCCGSASTGEQQPSNSFITPMGTSDSIDSANRRERPNRSSQTFHSYHQICVEDNTYASIDSANVGVVSSDDRPYAQIDKSRSSSQTTRKEERIPINSYPKIYSGRSPTKEGKYENISVMTSLEVTMQPSTSGRLQVDSNTLYADSVRPLSEVGSPCFPLPQPTLEKKKEDIHFQHNQLPRNKDTNEVSYAVLQLSPDEDPIIEPLAEESGIHYAELVLQDEDEKYHEETT